MHPAAFKMQSCFGSCVSHQHTSATMAKNADESSTVELPECEDAGANECVIDDEEGEEDQIDDDELIYNPIIIRWCCIKLHEKHDNSCFSF